jgi:hypothetical protein
VWDTSCDAITVSDAKYSIIDLMVWAVVRAVGTVHDGSKGTMRGSLLCNGKKRR